MAYPDEEIAAAYSLCDDLDHIEEFFYRRRVALLADLVALERERDERIQERRRERRKDHLPSIALLERLDSELAAPNKGKGTLGRVRFVA